MAFTANTGDHKVSRSDVFTVDPSALVIDWKKNLSRNGEEPPVDEGLMELARDMIPKSGQGDSASGSSGQLNAILVRPLPDRRLEVIGGFRRMRAALWLIESGEFPDFKIKYSISRMNDAEAALVNISENIQREDPKPIQLAHAIRSLTEDYGLDMKTVAGRLKRSESWCHNMIDLVMLPSKIQESVSNGHTQVGAALELTKLPPEKRVQVFDAIAEGGGKVTVAKVKKERREVAEKTGGSSVIPRTMKDMKEFLESRTGPVDGGQKLAKIMLKYIAGVITEESMNKFWDNTFDS